MGWKHSCYLELTAVVHFEHPLCTEQRVLVLSFGFFFKKKRKKKLLNSLEDRWKKSSLQTAEHSLSPLHPCVPVATMEIDLCTLSHVVL